MNWIQQWLSNRKNKESANPIDATDVANKWRNVSNNSLVTTEENKGNILDYSGLPVNNDIIPKEKTVNEKVDSLLSGYDTTFDTTKIIEDITEKTKEDENIGNNNSNIDTTYTEGSGTKLIQTADGTVMRVPVDQEIIGSTTIQVDDQAPVGEVNFESIPKDDNFRQGETAKAAWLYKTRNSPAAKAGISDERRWNLHLKNKAFQEAKKNKTLDQFAEDFPNSQYAKKLRSR